MSKMGKTIAALGVVAGLGVAALPMASYAAPVTGTTTASDNVTINVTVSDAISLELSSNEVTIDNVKAGTLSESDAVTASVLTNHPTGYNLTVISTAADAKLVEQSPVTGTTAATIDPWTDGTGWGVKGGTVTDYTAVPGSGDTALTLKTTDKETGLTADTTDITFGVNVKTGQRAATYQGVVTVTATVN